MKQVVEKGEKLNNEARNLLSVAYKNVVGCRRSSWRVVSSLASKAEEDSRKKELAEEYMKKIEIELDTICNEVLVRILISRLQCLGMRIHTLTPILNTETD